MHSPCNKDCCHLCEHMPSIVLSAERHISLNRVSQALLLHNERHDRVESSFWKFTCTQNPWVWERVCFNAEHTYTLTQASGFTRSSERETLWVCIPEREGGWALKDEQGGGKNTRRRDVSWWSFSCIETLCVFGHWSVLSERVLFVWVEVITDRLHDDKIWALCGGQTICCRTCLPLVTYDGPFRCLKIYSLGSECCRCRVSHTKDFRPPKYSWLHTSIFLCVFCFVWNCLLE